MKDANLQNEKFKEGRDEPIEITSGVFVKKF